MSEIIIEENRTVVKPNMDIVASMAEDFKTELMLTIDGNPGDLVLDLKGVEMVDSIGIGVIISIHNKLARAARDLKVINVSHHVFGLFSTMRLNRRFTVEAAI
ncbi:STAS domain-containing protein [Desulfocicer niacini]